MRQGFGAYLLLQVPAILLAGLILALAHRWVGLPAAWALGLFVLWVIKDLVLYPLLRSVLTPPATGPEALIGAPGVACDRLAPRGLVRIGGELWRAEAWRADEPIPAGCEVVVRERRGLLLMVEPRPDGSDGTPPGASPWR